MTTRSMRKTKKIVLFSYPGEPQELPLDELLPPLGGDDDGNPYMIPMVVITPEIARAFIERVAETDNRNERKANSNTFADSIDNGWFKRTHQGAAFDTLGRMFDGRHRMMGLLKVAETDPNATIVIDIHYNQPVENAPALDGGAKRSPSDHLQVAGIRGVRPVASLIRLQYLMEQTAGQVPKLTAVRHLRTEEYIERGHKYADKLSDSWRAVYPLRSNHNLGRNLNYAALFHFHVSSQWPDAPLEEFIDGIAEVRFADEDPRRAFHLWCSTAHRLNNIDGRHYYANLMITFNAWVNGVEGTPKKWQATKPFPELIIPERPVSRRRRRQG